MFAASRWPRTRERNGTPPSDGAKTLITTALYSAGMKPRLVICVTGMPGCGKEEFLKVAEEKGISIVRMGDVVREEATRRGLEMNDAAVGGMANEERLKHGGGVWAERTIPRVTGAVTVIDGLRAQAELDIFRRAFGNVRMVAVQASPETRYRRVLQRKRRDDVVTREAFARRDERELGWGLGNVIALADYTIVNEDNIKDFQRRAREVLAKLLG